MSSWRLACGLSQAKLIPFQETGKRWWASYLGIPFFGIGAFYCASRLIRPRPIVVIDESGIVDSASVVGAGHLRWEDIDHLLLYSYSGQSMLGIVPSDVESFLSGLNVVHRF